MQNMTSGVYKITNNITGDFYIGSSKNIKRRWTQHRNPSVRAQQPNSRLYKDIAYYGLDNFTFEIIEETDNLKEREQYFIDQLKPSYNNNWAQGLDIDNYRLYNREYHKAHYDYELAAVKAYNNRLCLYAGKTLTLNALALRFRQRGIANPCKEAKKYLL